MEDFLRRLNEFTRIYFNCNVKEFIEKGLQRGRHYYYLRDALNLTNFKFQKLIDYLHLDKKKIMKSKADYYKLFEQRPANPEDIEITIYA